MGVVEGKAFFDVIEFVQASPQQNHGVVAVGFDEIRAVGDHDHGSVAAFFEELDLAALAKAIIADGDDLVHEVAIELDDHREGKGEAGGHAGGVAFYRLAQVAAQLGELTHEGDLVFE